MSKETWTMIFSSVAVRESWTRYSGNPESTNFRVHERAQEAKYSGNSFEDYCFLDCIVPTK
jgi:hypothetical protein